MWRTRQWRKLLNLIDHLPRNSAYVEAISQDEELAEQMLAAQRGKKDEKKQKFRPRMSEYSPEYEALLAVVDRLGEVVVAQVASAGRRPPKIRPMPRPETATERVKERMRYEKHRRTVARVLPTRSDETAALLAHVPEAKPEPPKDRPVIAPGENPFRLTVRRRGAVPPPEPTE